MNVTVDLAVMADVVLTSSMATPVAVVTETQASTANGVRTILTCILMLMKIKELSMNTNTHD